MVHTTTTTKRWQSEGTNDSCQIKTNVSLLLFLLLLVLLVKCCKYVCVCKRTTRATTSFVSNSIILSFAIVNIHTNKCSSALAFAKYTHKFRERAKERDRQRKSYETHLMINNDFSLKSIIKKKKKKIERKKKKKKKRKAITSNYVSYNKLRGERRGARREMNKREREREKSVFYVYIVV